MLHSSPSPWPRRIRLSSLVLAAGVIYALLYMRTSYEITMLQAFRINSFQLGQCYCLLGVFLTLGYIPSGWLADRISPRILLSSSLLLTGLLGMWFWTLPDLTSLRIIFAGWGITAGMMFWGALIKQTNLIAHKDEQGRYFGILEGGRGVVEALVYTMAASVFAWLVSTGDSTIDAFKSIILVFVGFILFASAVCFFSLKQLPHEQGEEDQEVTHRDTFGDLKTIFKIKEVWLMALVIFGGYQVFYAVFSLSAFMQSELGLSAVMVGWISAARLWMRAIAPIAAGFLGDYWGVGRAASVVIALSSVLLVVISFMSENTPVTVVFVVALAIGIFTFAIRGLYWGTLNDCGIPLRVRGLAIGVISFIGYTPEMFSPLVSGYLVEAYPGKAGYAYYFIYSAVIGMLGTFAAWKLFQARKTRLQ